MNLDINTLLSIISQAVDLSLDRKSRNIEMKRQEIALQETAEFVNQQMPLVESFPDNFSLLKHALSLVQLNGLYCEFGVYSGRTINFLASLTQNKIYGFDSFEGLPETWRDGFKKGHFALNNLPTVKDNVILLKGWFDQTLPLFLKEHDEPLAFLHIDCDLYSSTKTIFDLCKNHICAGTIIVFDEFFNYPNWQQGEFKAFNEFVEQNAIQFEYIGYCRYHEQVAIKIK